MDACVCTWICMNSHRKCTGQVASCRVVIALRPLVCTSPLIAPSTHSDSHQQAACTGPCLQV